MYQSQQHTINELYLKRSTSWTVGRTMDTRLSLCEWKITLHYMKANWHNPAEYDTSAPSPTGLAAALVFIPVWTGRAEKFQACHNTWGCVAEESRWRRSLIKCTRSWLIRSKERKSSYLHDHTHDGERKNLPRTRRGPPVDVVASFNVKTKTLLVESEHKISVGLFYRQFSGLTGL